MAAMFSRCLILMVLAVAQPEPPGTGAVAGFVRYASGEPIAEVRVSLIVPGDQFPRTTRTGIDGSYRFDAVAAGEYQLSASQARAVAKRITITPGSELTGVDFSVANGGSRRVVPGRVVMNEASRGQKLPARIGRGLMRPDGTLVLPLEPGDHWVTVTLPGGYFLDTITHGSAILYSMATAGRRAPAAAVSITVRPEPEPMPELIITLGFSR